MSISAKIVAHSISEAGKEIVTYELVFHRYCMSEFNTHRALSRNASSSRAVKIQSQLSSVWNNMALPVHWGKNKAGMSAKEELTGWRLKAAKFLWKLSGKTACVFAYLMYKVGLHKQVVNRVSEPFSYIKVLTTATEWDNFFRLRAHPDAQPEIQALAYAMLAAYKESKPKLIKKGEWHLPYITEEMLAEVGVEDAKTLSVSLIAQTSYRAADFTMEKARKITNMLIQGDVVHASPYESVATPLDDPKEPSKNLVGWKQLRDFIPNNVCTNYKYEQ